MSGRLFTSESVTEGHPDKIADQISDSVLDEMLRQDPHSRVAVETLLTTGLVVVAGEVATTGYVDIKSIVRQRILDIGYDHSDKGFDGTTCGVMVAIGGQSGDIAQGVDTGYESRLESSVDAMDKQGAGDQGLMFGYACDDTPELMPLPIKIAQTLSERLSAVRKDGTLAYLRPDGKTQVTVEYDDDNRPVRIDTVVLSTQHAEDVDLETMLQPDIKKHVIDPVLASFDIPSEGYRLLVNPTGRFVVGGPMGDAGLTGRKIIVDTYGGMARHGGGAFSGKDPSKVDRSAAYAMRWVAKNVVAAGLARRCEVQVAYAIGKAQPVGVFIETFGTGTVADDVIQKAVLEVFDLRPAAIIAALDLLRPVHEATDGLDGFVSVEVDPNLAADTAGTEEAARHLSRIIDRPNLFVKIPATAEGIPAIRTMIGEGCSVNVTLIFSLDRYEDVMEAYIAGLEDHEGDLSGIASVASFFISRTDTEIDRRLEAIGTPAAMGLRGRAAVAQGQVAYDLFRSAFSGPRWEALAARGARVQRPLWASTSTKNPAYPDTLYVDTLIGPDTVNTLPEVTLEAFDDHGTLARTVDADPEGARSTLAAVESAGVDLGDVARVLEEEGVGAFVKSFDELLGTLGQKAEALA